MTGQPSTVSTVAEVSASVRTFLIADVRGYTRFTLEHGDEAAAQLASRFADLATQAVEAYEGKVTELRGDEALAVFTSPRQALRASVDLQGRFGAETQETSLPLQVGIGLDSGEAIPVADGYRGAALNLAARLCALAGPGEVLASDTVANLARRIEGVEYAERGMVRLKGFADPVRVMEVHPTRSESRTTDKTGSLATNGREHLPMPIGGFLGALPEGLLVARKTELDQILRVVDSVTQGAGRFVLLAGEPGVGKTRLAQEVTLACRNRGFLVATGRCYESHQAMPFYPFFEALTSAYKSASPAVRFKVEDRWPVLGRLLPNQGIEPPPASAEGAEDQQRLFWAITGFLQELAGEQPVALLIDDLHWVDGSSLQLLEHLVRQTRGSPVLLLGTYRDVEVGRQHPLESALLDFRRERLMEDIRLRRMSQGRDGISDFSFGRRGKYLSRICRTGAQSLRRQRLLRRGGPPRADRAG